MTYPTYLTYEQALDATRPDWERYQNMSTPWPSDPERRRECIAERLRITQERLRLIDPNSYHAREFRAEIAVDQRYLSLLL